MITVFLNPGIHPSHWVAPSDCQPLIPSLSFTPPSPLRAPPARVLTVEGDLRPGDEEDKDGPSPPQLRDVALADQPSSYL